MTNSLSASTLRQFKPLLDKVAPEDKEGNRSVPSARSIPTIAIVAIAAFAAYYLIGIRGFVGFSFGACYAKSTDLQRVSSRLTHLFFEMIQKSPEGTDTTEKSEVEEEAEELESGDSEDGESLPLFKAFGDLFAQLLEAGLGKTPSDTSGATGSRGPE